MGPTARIVALAAVAAGLGLALSACGGVGEDRFYRKLYKRSCKHAFECDAYTSEREYGDRKGCREAFDAEADAAIAYYAACDYHPRKARRYLRAIRKLECEADEAALSELDSAWEEVYDCPPPVNFIPSTPTTSTTSTTTRDTGL